MIWWIAVVIPWLVSLPFDPRRKFAHCYACLWANHFLRISPFWEVRVEGTNKIKDDQAYVIVANHQSSADIMVLFALQKQFRWVAKSSLFLVPFLGWMMWMTGYIPIRRGDRLSREKMIKRCLEQIRMGNSILLFPEGTRSESPEMRPFKRGAFMLAVEANVPVIPVVIHGTRNTLPRASLIFSGERKSKPLVSVLDPIDPKDCDGDPKRLQAEVRAIMEVAREKIRNRINAERSEVHH